MKKQFPGIDDKKMKLLMNWQMNGGEKTMAQLVKETPETRQDILTIQTIDLLGKRGLK